MYMMDGNWALTDRFTDMLLGSLGRSTHVSIDRASPKGTWGKCQTLYSEVSNRVPNVILLQRIPSRRGHWFVSCLKELDEWLTRTHHRHRVSETLTARHPLINLPIRKSVKLSVQYPDQAIYSHNSFVAKDGNCKVDDYDMDCTVLSWCLRCWMSSRRRYKKLKCVRYKWTPLVPPSLIQTQQHAARPQDKMIGGIRPKCDPHSGLQLKREVIS